MATLYDIPWSKFKVIPGQGYVSKPANRFGLLGRRTILSGDCPHHINYCQACKDIFEMGEARKHVCPREVEFREFTGRYVPHPDTNPHTPVDSAPAKSSESLTRGDVVMEFDPDKFIQWVGTLQSQLTDAQAEINSQSQTIKALHNELEQARTLREQERVGSRTVRIQNEHLAAYDTKR